MNVCICSELCLLHILLRLDDDIVLRLIDSDLARHHNGATEGTALHDEADHTIAGTSDSKSSEELVAQGLALGHGAEATVQHLLGVQLNGSGGEVEPLLHNSGELANATALLAQHVLGTGGTDDNLVTGRSLADFDAGVAILGKLTDEKLVQLSVENSVSDELALLRHVLGG